MTRASSAKATYGPRALERTGLLTDSDLEANDAAHYLLFRFKDPRVRPTTLVVDGGDDALLWMHMLTRSLNDRITIKRRPLGGGAVISQDAHIEGIEHSFGPAGQWRTTWHLVPAGQFSFWLLGDSTFGKLGEMSRLGY